MERRAFVNVTAGAAAALTFKPLARAFVPVALEVQRVAMAGEQERKSPVPYPDAAVASRFGGRGAFQSAGRGRR